MTESDAKKNPRLPIDYPPMMDKNMDAMRRAALLAGHAAAHGVLSVSTGGQLIPFCVFEDDNGGRSLTRFAFGDPDAAFKGAISLFGAGSEGASMGAMVYPDVFVRNEMGLDAMMVAARTYPAREPNMRLAVTFEPADSAYGFSVFDPEIMEHPGIEDNNFRDVLSAFWEGRDSHSEAAAVWTAAYQGPPPI
ncbi:MAG: hypothetical protein AAF732_07385 [Pseudomonadota bacterium]